MPLYEYHCSKCGKNFDVIQKFSDAPLAVHEGCGGAVEKMMSAPSFHLKGSGWYVTEYGKGGKVPAAADSSDSKSGETKANDSKSAVSKSDSSSESKSEAKSEPKAESKTKSKTEAKSESKPTPAKSE